MRVNKSAYRERPEQLPTASQIDWPANPPRPARAENNLWHFGAFYPTLPPGKRECFPGLRRIWTEWRTNSSTRSAAFEPPHDCHNHCRWLCNWFRMCSNRIWPIDSTTPKCLGSGCIEAPHRLHYRRRWSHWRQTFDYFPNYRNNLIVDSYLSILYIITCWRHIIVVDLKQTVGVVIVDDYFSTQTFFLQIWLRSASVTRVCSTLNPPKHSDSLHFLFAVRSDCFTFVLMLLFVFYRAFLAVASLLQLVLHL